ncbi:MAG: metal-sulfur cluster assembly factor [Arcobacteraceae bacterium]
MVTKEELFKEISTVMDPEVGFNLVEMGLIYDATSNEEGHAIITMTLSTKACPLHQMIVQWVQEAALRVEGVKSCEVELVWEPAWNITMADEHVKKALMG